MIKGRVTVLFFVLILSIVFVLMWFSNNHQFLSFSDGAKFADIARNIKNGQGYGSTFSFFTDSAFQLISEGLFSARWIPPLMPLSILGSFFLFGVGDFAVYFTSGMFFVGLVILVFLIGRKIFSNFVGLLAALTVAANINLLDYPPGEILKRFVNKLRK